jgi:glycerol-3-phosphate dehydrogenase (NAD(P)+)
MGEKVGFIGAGSWGTALANLLATNGHEVRIWDLDTELLDIIEEHRENRKYLPGVQLADGITVVRKNADVVKDASLVVFAVPAQHFRSAVTSAAQHMRADAIILNVAKGIEQKSLKIISQIAEEFAPDHTYVDLSGPSHAEEVGKFLPTTVAVASKDIAAAEFVQDVFTTNHFRVYTNDDVMGLELGGSLKNIIALGAGISDGMGFGDNTKAALMTRGIAEIIRLGVALGAKAETFSGLAGIGDLIVTCTSMHSRNRRCGIMLGEGIAPDEAVKRVGMVVEGIFTAEAAVELAKREGIEMPITENIYKVVKGEIEPQTALKELMTRPLKHESEPV